MINLFKKGIVAVLLFFAFVFLACVGLVALTHGLLILF